MPNITQLTSIPPSIELRRNEPQWYPDIHNVYHFIFNVDMPDQVTDLQLAACGYVSLDSHSPSSDSGFDTHHCIKCYDQIGLLVEISLRRVVSK